MQGLCPAAPLAAMGHKYYICDTKKLPCLKKYILPIALLSATFSSCCKEEACLELKGVPINFYGYKRADLDTIYITGYEKGTGFGKESRKEERDTVQKGLSNDTTTFSLKIKSGGIAANGQQGNALPDTHDWKIYIPAVPQTIYVSNYGYQNYTCESCGKNGNKQVQTLSTCNINGTNVKVDAVMIYR